ncbi:GAF domain-containing protein [Marinoscillum furvescens]|uniref:GAF domain-containing protein n=1 Tax=Marinoscillum furvescens DSM 4134 TaxID=1122208 RepID=A0A3D9L188_MARFU|nr:GAF domain-containing protein [Marinoscillum furvescens]RED97060.1 GAF domain-containing protein [Marinoscillum furvescens DSM 4134]
MKKESFRHAKHQGFTRELLAEAEDEELKAIVEEAASKIGVPIALVSLVMEDVQFFKAHYGLPDDLINVKGSSKDASLCQFVVSHQAPFEVGDTDSNNEIPQEFIQKYGIKSYMGMPIKSNDQVVGSLCVLDTKPRAFEQQHRKSLEHLAELVDNRLKKLNETQKTSRARMLQSAVGPALDELHDGVPPIREGLSVGYMSTTEIGMLLRMAESALYGKVTSKEEVRDHLEKARLALERCQNGLYNIEASLEDMVDSMDALTDVLKPAESSTLLHVAESGRELSRHITRQSGGVSLGEFEYDPFISTPRAFASSLIAMVLSQLAARLLNEGLTSKLKISAERSGLNAALIIEADGLKDMDMPKLVDELNTHTHEEPTVSFNLEEHGVRLLFAAIQEKLGD